MLRLGFAEIGLHRIFAQCRAENLASRPVMARRSSGRVALVDHTRQFAVEQRIEELERLR
jgi:RimJ/RimL family protein N-acetyltransferase